MYCAYTFNFKSSCESWKCCPQLGRNLSKEYLAQQSRSKLQVGTGVSQGEFQHKFKSLVAPSIGRTGQFFILPGFLVCILLKLILVFVLKNDQVRELKHLGRGTLTVKCYVQELSAVASAMMCHNTQFMQVTEVALSGSQRI